MTTPISNSNSSSNTSAQKTSNEAPKKDPAVDGDLALDNSASSSQDSYESSSQDYRQVLGQVSTPAAANGNISGSSLTADELRQQEQARTTAADAPKDCVDYVPNADVPGVWSPVGNPNVMTDSPTDACPVGQRPTIKPDNTNEAPSTPSQDPAPSQPESVDPTPPTPSVPSAAGPRDADSAFIAEAIKDQVAELDSPGDSVKIAGSGFAKVEFGGKVGGEMQIERTEDGYTVSMGGEASAIFAPEVGGAAGIKADIGVEFAMGNVAKTELNFSSKEELDNFVDSVASFDPTSASSRANLANEFSSHISAVEYGAKLSGQAVAELGGGRSLGGDVTGGSEYQGVVRAEFENGHASAVGVRLDLKPLDVGLGAGAFKFGGDNSLGVGGPSANIGAEVQASLEFKLKRDEQGGRFVPDGQATLTVAGDLNGQIGPIGGNLQGQFQVDLDTARTRDLLTQVAASDNGQTAALNYLRAAGELPKVSVQGAAYDTEGLNLSPEIKAFGVGVGGELEIERKDVGRIRQFEMTPTDALNWMID